MLTVCWAYQRGSEFTSAPLRNTRHEAFAQALAKGMTADAAYRQAGYKPDRGHASRLAANGSIQARVVEITAKAAARAEITKADVLRGLLAEARMGLDDDPKPNAARVAAWRLLGLELGMFAERRGHDVADRMAELITAAKPLPIGATPMPASSRFSGSLPVRSDR